MKAVMFLRNPQAELLPLAEGSACMVRLCGRPLLEYSLELLAACGIKECTFVAKEGLDAVKDHYPNLQFSGIALQFFSEFDEWNGPVSSQEGFSYQPVLIMDDRILCDFALSDLIKTHMLGGSDLTAAVIGRETGLGSVQIGRGRDEILSKKDTGYWNTGIYILSPHTADMIQQGKKTSNGNLFAEIMQSGMQISTWNGNGYWRRIDSLQSYQQAQKDLLEGRVRCKLRGIRDERGNLIAGRCPSGNFKLSSPVFIGAGVHLGGGSVIGAYSVLDDRCTVASGAMVQGATLLPCSFVGEHGCVKSGVVCSGAFVKSGITLEDGVAVHVPAHQDAPSFEQNAVIGEVGVELTPEIAARIGCAVGTLARGQTIGIASEEDICSSRVLNDALTAGIRSTGTSVLDFGCVFESLFRFAMEYNALRIGICLSIGKSSTIKIIDHSDHTSNPSLAQKLQSILMKNRFSRAPWDGFGGCIDMSGIGVIYRTELLRLAPDGLADLNVQVTSSSHSVKNLLADALQKLGCDQSGGILIHLSRDGMDLYLSDEHTKISRDRTAALGKWIQRESAMERKKNLCRKGCMELFYENSDWDDRDNRSSENDSRVQDGLMLAVRFLDYMKKRQISLAELDRLLPDLKKERLSAKQGQKEKGLPDEALEKKGVLLLCPQKKGNSKRVFADASGWEIAQELCAKPNPSSGGLLDKERRNG